MIKLKDLLFEELDLDSANKLAERLNKEIKAPVVHAKVSTLGGQLRPAVLLSVSLDEKNTWNNNIYENSRHMRFDITDGVVEQFQKSHKISKKFRKSRWKKFDDLIKKLNVYIHAMATEKYEPKPFTYGGRR